MPPTASVLAHKYGVTGKAIRDVWTHKTWACATRPFWPAADDSDGGEAPAEKRKKHDQPALSADKRPRSDQGAGV